MKKNVLITGASGNLGKATVDKFLKEGYNVLATVTPGKTLGFPAPGVQLYEADLTDENSVNASSQTNYCRPLSLACGIIISWWICTRDYSKHRRLVIKKNVVTQF